MMTVFAYFGIFCFLGIIYVFVTEKIKKRKAKKLIKKAEEELKKKQQEQEIEMKLSKSGESEKPEEIVIDDKN